ncbi:hypothetical protein FPV33_04415 [Klebsiella aerogenes]|nr:hypothetical protein FPV33_04415 [Klebsiella aerogenes]RNT23525.1 hypothetical protein B9037_024395 [Klebsiella aerogenes]TSI57049.1 hypothetical protein FPI68_07405 [Klebsiella aerogenes]TSI75900.1 hypothetical protein FPI67_07405 [Klebsiella aerogenes]TSI94989.1 hypothetical protein FPI76_07405 [Klebsiella aerogenes]
MQWLNIILAMMASTISLLLIDQQHGEGQVRLILIFMI